MKTRFLFFVTIVLVGFAGRILSAADADPAVKADEAYSQKRYDEAAAGYQELVRAGHWNAKL